MQSSLDFWNMKKKTFSSASFSKSWLMLNQRMCLDGCTTMSAVPIYRLQSFANTVSVFKVDIKTPPQTIFKSGSWSGFNDNSLILFYSWWYRHQIFGTFSNWRKVLLNSVLVVRITTSLFSDEISLINMYHNTCTNLYEGKYRLQLNLLKIIKAMTDSAKNIPTKVYFVWIRQRNFHLKILPGPIPWQVPARFFMYLEETFESTGCLIVGKKGAETFVSKHWWNRKYNCTSS